MNETINPTSSLEVIAEYVRTGFRRSAVDVWNIGHALKIAKAKNGRTFGKWCNKEFPFLSRSTISRYMRVAELPRDVIEGERLNDVYKILFPADDTVKKNEPSKTEPVEPTTDSGIVQVPEVVHATAEFDTVEPVQVPEHEDRQPASGIRYTFTASILLDPNDDIATIEGLINSGQVHFTAKNGKGKTLAGITIESVKALERIQGVSLAIAA